MAGQNWSINIVQTEAGASFIPDVYGVDPDNPTPLQAQFNDLVSWSNQTDEDHHLWITNSSYHPLRVLTNRIPAHDSSSPGYIPQQKDVWPATTTPPPPDQTIYYCCSLHPDEYGSITVVA